MTVVIFATARGVAEMKVATPVFRAEFGLKLYA
jgi:hypothetical protein